MFGNITRWKVEHEYVTNTNGKSCRDCKHFHVSWFDQLMFHPKYIRETCRSPDTGDTTFCNIARKYDFLKDSCGSAARFWQPK